MFNVEFFNQYREYEKRSFNNRKEFVKFLKECEQNDSIEVLNFTDHYDVNED